MKKTYLIPLFLPLLLSILSVCCYGYEVIALKSENIEPYDLAMDGFRNFSNANIKEYNIEEFANENKKINDANAADADVKENKGNLIEIIKTERPDIILAVGLEALLKVKGKIHDIPIVYCMVMDPEKYNITESNITGIALRLSVKEQMLSLKTILPDLKELGVIYNSENTSHIIKNAKKISKETGIKLTREAINNEKQVPNALRRLAGHVDALWLIADSTVITKESYDYIILFALENNMPLVTFSEAFVKAGALLSYSANYSNLGKQAAILSKSIVNKEKTSFPSILEPEKTNLVINSNTANSIGANIPKYVLDSAKKVLKFITAER